jgi:hypothetical protein
MRGGAAAGSFYLVTGLLTGYAAVYQMMQTVNGGSWSWSYPLMLGASVLLLVSGVHDMFVNISTVWLALIAAAFPIGFCALFGATPVRCWVFAIFIGAVTWACFTLAGGRRPGLPALIGSSALIASWLPSSVATMYAYLFRNPPVTNRPVLTTLIIFWIFLLAAMMISSISFFRARQP